MVKYVETDEWGLTEITTPKDLKLDKSNEYLNSNENLLPYTQKKALNKPKFRRNRNMRKTRKDVAKNRSRPIRNLYDNIWEGQR